MHSVLEGVIKNFFHHWFDSKYSHEPYSLRRHLEDIDKRLVRIQPPSFIPAAPRSITTYANWRAKEFLAFIIFYSIPVFYDIMPNNLFSNLKKLVIFLEFLLSKKISKSKLNLHQDLIESFLKELSILYKPTIMLSGIHEMVHFIEITKQFGPVNLINCFVYEELNRKLINLVKGKDLIGEEFIKNFSTLQSLGTYLNNTSSLSETIEYAKSNFVIKTSNKKCLYRNSNTFKINHRFDVRQIENKISKISSFFNREININEAFNSILLNEIRYNSKTFSTKFSDCFIKTNDNRYGYIEFFFMENNEIYVFAKLLLHYEKFCVTNFEEIDPKMSLFSETNEGFFISNIKTVKKVFGTHMFSCKNFYIISSMEVSHLFF